MKNNNFDRIVLRIVIACTGTMLILTILSVMRYLQLTNL